MTPKRDPKFGCAEIYEDIWFLLDRAELKLTPDWTVVIGDGTR